MSIQSIRGQSGISSLQRRWLAFALLSASLLAGGYTLLRFEWEALYALRWLLLASGAGIYLLLVLGTNLLDNHRPGEKQVIPYLGMGNRISLARGLLLAGLAGFLFSPWPGGWLAWLPGGLYLTAVIADLFDGYAARRTGQITRLGEILDISLDGLGVLAAAWLAVQYGQAPYWYTLVALARYLFLGGQWLRQRRGLPIYPMPHSFTRRALAGVQMGFAAALLLPIFSPPGTHLAAALFATPFLIGFVKDWLYVSGVLHPRTDAQSAGQSGLAEVLPVILRLAAAGLLALFLLDRSLSPQEIGHAAVLVAITVGIAGRGAAVAGLCLLGLSQPSGGFSSFQMFQLVLYVALLYLGTGRFSIWQPEEGWIFRPTGEAA